MSGVQSVGRAFALLEALGADPSSLSELARRVDLPVSTTARLLGTLEDLGAVERVDGSSYRIGPSIVHLAKGLDVSTRLQSLAAPELEALAAQSGQAAGLSIPAGNQMHFVAQVGGESTTQPEKDWVGARLAMSDTASGLAALAFTAGDHTSASWHHDSAGPSSVAAAVLGSDQELLGAVHVHGARVDLEAQPDLEASVCSVAAKLSAAIQ